MGQKQGKHPNNEKQTGDSKLDLGDDFNKQYVLAEDKGSQNIVVGHGAKGVVLLCRSIKSTSERNDDLLAVKVMNTQDISLSIEHGIRCLRDLTGGPNIVQLIGDPFASPSSTSLVLEYAQGGELFEYVNKRKQLSELEAIDGLNQIAKGINFIHRAGYVHRDLKPENILLFGHEERQDNFVWKISDFDFAKELGKDSEWCSTKCGTPLWGAPEVLTASTPVKYLGPPVDVWGIGMIAYFCIGGYRAFEHATDEYSGVPLLEFHAERWQHVSTKCIQFCEKTLEREPLRRLHWKKLQDSCKNLFKTIQHK